MMRCAFALLLVLASPVFAQTAPDRIAAQIGTLYIQGQQQQDQISNLSDQLAKALARVKELEAKDRPPEEKK